jgi:magnesium-transporting ATPase (P-type)
MQRDVFENDLDFLGFVIMENKIKLATDPTI